MAALIFAPRVGANVQNIGDWITRHNPDRAVACLKELIVLCHKLTEFPFAYPPFPRLGADARRANHGSYAIFYDVVGDVVTILAIVHGARNLDALF